MGLCFRLRRYENKSNPPNDRPFFCLLSLNEMGYWLKQFVYELNFSYLCNVKEVYFDRYILIHSINIKN